MTAEAADQARSRAMRVAQNHDQVRVAEHLIVTARDRLAGRDENGRELVGVRPRERVVLGVLLPQPRPTVAPAATVTATPYEPGVPVDHLPASEMGLSALVVPSTETFELRVRSTFALYLQHAPTHDQQAEHSGLPTDEVDEVDDRPPDGDDPSAVREGNAGDGRQRRDVNDSAPSAGAHISNSAPEVVRQAPTRTGARSTSDYLRPVYRRYDIAVEHRLSVSVPQDARPHTVSESTRYAHAMANAIAPGHPTSTGRFAGSLLAPLRGNSAVRVPRDVVLAGSDDYERYLRDHARADWATPLPEVSFRATIQRTPDGPFRLSLTLVNESTQPDRDRGFVPEVSLYDARFRVALDGAAVAPSEYRVHERDYRTEPLVYAHGQFCCLDEEVFLATGELCATTWPVHRQYVYESKPELQPTFQELATDPLPALDRIEQHMAAFAAAWDTYLSSSGLTPAARQACIDDRQAFADELRRFRRGVHLIRADLSTGRNGLGAAFTSANEAFRLMNTTGGLNSSGSPTARTWRLFQIVYVVANLPALSAREASAADVHAWVTRRYTGEPGTQSPGDLDELDVADVLWFPTGGGKSAALYGIIAVALFFDRLRGKAAGVTATIRFPLRMLSVQQLERVLRLVAACEIVRGDLDGAGGEPFRLGYWVGRSNTPNQITNAADERWHDIAWMARQSPEWKHDNTVVPTCPYCGASEVALEPDPASVRLPHRCRACDMVLPVDVTDDEVYRYLPSVVVCTVDKIAALAFNSHASHLTHGPTHSCPDHGYVTHPQGRERRCLARDLCTRTPSDWSAVSIKDPAPALVVQDELHLLSEELGTFAAHFETLWQHLCTVGSGLPSKVLAATATISDYQNQVTQLYALTPRRFPTDGWTDGESFYAKRHDDLVRRVFVGALPTQMDVVQFSLAAGAAVREELSRLAAMPADLVIDSLSLDATDPADVAELLFQYELHCFYCNRKTHADHVHSSAERAGRDNSLSFQSVKLNGQTKLAEISDVIRRIERETLKTPPASRLGSIAGTSLISHGVDLERLNVLFVLGMPSTVAYYVQATSRAGRTGVGIVFTGLARHFVRDRSVFHFFDAQHRFVNVLVEPVALNRFSTHGPRKTASGLLAAILIQQWGRDPMLLGAVGLTAPADLSRGNDARHLLTRMRDRAASGDGPDPGDLACTGVRAAYGLRAMALDPDVARLFASTVDHQVAATLASIEAAHEWLLTKSMRPRPPTSLRDVDAVAAFGAAGYAAIRRFTFLGGDDYEDDEADYTVADEA